MRAWQRELPWAPRYVANELAGTRQAATNQRQTASLRAAEAQVVADPAERARLEQEARDAVALAETLDNRAAELQQLDYARAQFLAHTAMTRAEAQQAEMILAERHALDAEPEERVTADEWLAAHHDAVVEDERHRVVTEDDIVAHEHNVRDDGRRLAEPDLREIAAAEPNPVAEDLVRVPTAEDVVSALAQAERALAEMRAREALDEREAAEHRAEQLARWHADDAVTDREIVDENALDRADAW